MIRWFYVALHLLVEALAARRDAHVRFMKAQIEILRRKLGGNRVIPSPDDRARLMAIGRELNRATHADILDFPARVLARIPNSCSEFGPQLPRRQRTP